MGNKPMTLARTDAVRAAVALMIEGLDAAEADALVLKKKAGGDFRDALTAQVLADYPQMATQLADAAGVPRDSLFVRCNFELTDEALTDDLPEMIDVVLTDGENWNCRVSLRLRVPLKAGAFQSLGRWLAAHRVWLAAVEEGRTVKAQDSKARNKVVNDLLGTLPEGLAVLDALRVFSAALKVSRAPTD